MSSDRPDLDLPDKDRRDADRPDTGRPDTDRPDTDHPDTGRPVRRGLDRIELRGLRARGRHGVLPAERELGQEFVVDVSLGLDTAPAAADDDLSRTVDYGSLASRLVAVVEGEPVALIETLAERLAAVCLQDATVTEVEVTVHKPSAPVPHPFTDVAVKIRRIRP